MDKVLKFLRPGVPYFAFGASFFVFQILMSVLPIPDFPTILVYLRGMLHSYGLWAVGVAYFIEGLFLISFYWPGSFVLFLAVAAAAGSTSLLAHVWLVINLAGFAALTANAAIGRYGLHHVMLRLFGTELYKRATEVAARRGAWALLILGFHINWLAMAVVYFASLRKPSLQRVLGIGMVAHACGSGLLIILCSSIDLTNEGTNANIIMLLIAGSFAIGIYTCIRQHGRVAVQEG